jgi:hypothetical protein
MAGIIGFLLAKLVDVFSIAGIVAGLAGARLWVAGCFAIAFSFLSAQILYEMHAGQGSRLLSFAGTFAAFAIWTGIGYAIRKTWISTQRR